MKGTQIDDWGHIRNNISSLWSNSTSSQTDAVDTSCMMICSSHKMWSISTRTKTLIILGTLIRLLVPHPSMLSSLANLWKRNARRPGEVGPADHTLISSSADFGRSDFLLDMMLLKFSDLHSRISIWNQCKNTCSEMIQFVTLRPKLKGFTIKNVIRWRTS